MDTAITIAITNPIAWAFVSLFLFTRRDQFNATIATLLVLFCCRFQSEQIKLQKWKDETNNTTLESTEQLSDTFINW